MNADQHQKMTRWIEAHLDGLLDAAQQQSFERLRGQNAVLRAELEGQALIDEAIRRLFAPPSVDALRAKVLGLPAVTAVPRRAKVSPLIWGTAAAAAALLLAVGGWWGWMTWQDESGLTPRAEAPILPKMRVEQVYQDLVASGFKPKWVCDDVPEFATTFYLRLGQGLVFKNPPAGVAMVGLSYFNTLSPETIVFLADVRGQKALVFIDQSSEATVPTLPENSGLKVFSRRINRLVLYEVTPLTQPSLLDHFEEIDVPSEWIKNSTYRP